MKIMPTRMDENFGIGCAENTLDHLTIDPVFEPFVQRIVDMSRDCLDGAINWIDANLGTVIRDTMRDKDGNEIDEECTETIYRVEEGRVTVVINDQNGAKAYFELGAATSIWPGKLSDVAPTKPEEIAFARKCAKFARKCAKTFLTKGNWGGQGFTFDLSKTEDEAAVVTEPEPEPDETAGSTRECETCRGRGTIDETLGGERFSSREAKCPDCDGKGYFLFPRHNLATLLKSTRRSGFF